MAKKDIPSPFNLVISDPHSKGDWHFKIEGKPQVSYLTQDQFSIVLNSERRRFGDFDEQRDWSGGRGGERYSDDSSRYKDAKEAWAWYEGYLFPSLQWQFSSGYRSADFAMVGSKSWRGLFGSTQSISRTFTASASYNADKAWIWMRRVGTPDTMTLELRTNSSGSPSSTVLKSATVTTSTITDVVSVLQVFDWTSTQALVSGTTYHIVVCGADTDNDLNHWEVAVDTSGVSSKYSASGAGDTGSWTTADFSMYYRITDADINRRWWFFIYNENLYKVSNEAVTKLYKWDETTDVWSEITGHGLTTVTGRPVEMNNFCYFPCGDTTAIRVYNGSAWDAQTVASGQGCATGLALGFSESDNKIQMWRYNNALVSGGTATGLRVSVSRADVVAPYTTDLTFRESKLIGDNSTLITGIDSVNNTLWVRKSNEIGTVTSDRYTELDYGIKKTPSSNNGIAFVAWNGLIYYNWLFSTQRVFSGTVDNVGSKRFPSGRQGIDSSYTTYVAWMFIANDAGASGTSSVLLYDGLAQHEFARAWASGRRIRDVFVQPVANQRARLWFDCGGDSMFIELPDNAVNPLDDSSMKYMHEAVLESSEIDMGTASKLPKFIKEMTLTSKNLDGKGKVVYFDYQLDDEVGDTTYENTPPIDRFVTSPEDSININEGNLRRFAYRLRLLTDNQLVPPIIRGIVPNGFARSPARRVLDVTAEVKDFTVKGKVQKASDVINWLEELSESAYMVHVRSAFEQYDDFYGVLAPPQIYPVKTIPDTNLISFTILVL